MKTLKVEEVCRAGYETFADVAARLPVFIEQIYNAKRLHSARGYRTPEESETLFARKAAQFGWRDVAQPEGFTPYPGQFRVKINMPRHETMRHHVFGNPDNSKSLPETAARCREPNRAADAAA